MYVELVNINVNSGDFPNGDPAPGGDEASTGNALIETGSIAMIPLRASSRSRSIRPSSCVNVNSHRSSATRCSRSSRFVCEAWARMRLVSRRAIYASTADVARILPRKWSIKLKFMISFSVCFLGFFFILTRHTLIRSSKTLTQTHNVRWWSAPARCLRFSGYVTRTRSRFPTPSSTTRSDSTRSPLVFFFRCLPDGKSFDFVFQVSVQEVHQFRHRVDRNHVLGFSWVREACDCHDPKER